MPAGPGDHSNHPRGAAAALHEPVVVPAKPAADRLDGAAGGGGEV